MTGVLQQLDGIPRPFLFVGMILGFILFWPIGLAVLAYLFWSKRMGCASQWNRGDSREGWSRGGSVSEQRWERKMQRFQDKMNRWGGGRAAVFTPTGNAAFDEYREEMLRKLEDEAKEFQDFMKRLRMARDKQEFDQYMAERRAPTTNDGGEGEKPQDN
jgi:hypothetical protein